MVFKKRRLGNMLIYMIILGALVAIIYLIQFQTYGHSRRIDLKTDLLEKNGLHNEHDLEDEPESIIGATSQLLAHAPSSVALPAKS